MPRLKEFLQKRKYTGFVAAGVIIGLGFLLWGRNGANGADETIIVSRGTVEESAFITGRVRAAQDISLAFEKSGRVALVRKKAGDQVLSGELIASLDGGEARARLLQAEAKLSELLRGSRPEEIAVKQAELEKSEQDLANTYGAVADLIVDSYRQGEDAVRSKTSGIFSGDVTSGYKFTLSSCDTQLANNTNILRQKAENELISWTQWNTAVLPNLLGEALLPALDSAYARSITFRTFLETTDALLKAPCVLSNAGYDAYRTNVASGKNAIATVISDLNNKRDALRTFGATAKKVEAELALLLAGTAKESLDIQKAKVLEAKEEVSRYALFSPIPGVVSKIDIEAGEILSANVEIARIVSDSDFSVESHVPESEIGKLKIGQEASIALDAYGSTRLFSGIIASLDPAAAIQNDIPSYTVQIAFSGTDDRVRSGMTANVSVSTTKKEGVLFLPARALFFKDGKQVVRKRVGDAEEEASVVIGIRGKNGEVEILSGLSEGDVVLIKRSTK